MKTQTPRLARKTFKKTFQFGSFNSFKVTYLQKGEAVLLDRVWLEKVCLVTRVFFVYEEEQSYARELLEEQLAMGWEGLTREVEEICGKVGLPKACRQYISREQVLDHIQVSNLKHFKSDMEGLSKLEEMKN